MDWKPLADRVIVKKIKPPEKTASGIIMVEDLSTESLRDGEVVAVGAGKWSDGKRIPVAVEVGDIVGYSKHFGTDLPDTDYLLLHEEDILFVKNDEE